MRINLNKLLILGLFILLCALLIARGKCVFVYSAGKRASVDITVKRAVNLTCVAMVTVLLNSTLIYTINSSNLKLILACHSVIDRLFRNELSLILSSTKNNTNSQTLINFKMKLDYSDLTQS